MHLDHADILERNLRALECHWQREDWALQKLIERVGRGECVAAQIADRLQPLGLRFFFRHEQHRRRAIGQRG